MKKQAVSGLPALCLPASAPDAETAKPDTVLFFLTSGNAPVYEKRSMGGAA